MAASPTPNLHWPFRRLGERVSGAGARALRRVAGGGAVSRDLEARRRQMALRHRERERAGVKAGPVTGYRGHRIWRETEGWRTSADPESVFESQADVKAFVKSLKNPRPEKKIGWVPAISGGAMRTGGQSLYDEQYQRYKLLEKLRDEGVTHVGIGRPKRYDWEKEPKTVPIHKLMRETQSKAGGVTGFARREAGEENPSDWPMVDPSLLSPSGRVSKRAERVAKERARRELFPEGMPRPGLPPQPSEREYLLRKAADLRRLAEGGMKARAYRKEAERLERLAAEMNPSPSPEHLAAAQVAAEQARDLMRQRTKDRAVVVQHPDKRRHAGEVLTVTPDLQASHDYGYRFVRSRRGVGVLEQDYFHDSGTRLEDMIQRFLDTGRLR